MFFVVVQQKLSGRSVWRGLAIASCVLVPPVWKNVISRPMEKLCMKMEFLKHAVMTHSDMV